MNNSKNRDLLSILRAQGLVDYGYGDEEEDNDNHSWFSEDDMIDYLDKKRSK
jgi:hypothetical protein